MSEKSVAERISQIMSELGENQNSFSNKVGVSPSTIATAIARNKGVNTDLIQKILFVYTNISSEWLLTGRGSMFKNEVKGEKEEIEEKKRELSIYNLKTDYYETDKQRIPLYELSMSAGLSILFASQITQVPLDYITIPNAPKCDGAMFVRGDSMYPVLKSGDIACYKHIESLDDIYYGEIYLLDMEVAGDQHLTTKYIQKSELGDEYLCLVSHNKNHSPKDVHKSSIRALAIVKLSIRYHTLS